MATVRLTTLDRIRLTYVAVGIGGLFVLFPLMWHVEKSSNEMAIGISIAIAVSWILVGGYILRKWMRFRCPQCNARFFAPMLNPTLPLKKIKQTKGPLLMTFWTNSCAECGHVLPKE